MAYVYRHIRLDKNEPFYIGIGRNCKGNYTRANHGAELRRNSIIWKRIVAKTEYSVEILVDELTWEEIKTLHDLEYDSTKKELQKPCCTGKRGENIIF